MEACRGRVHFTPDLDKNDGNVGPAGFTVTYKATDGDKDSGLATLTISVSAVNDATVAVDDAASTQEDTAVAKDVITNDTDVDNTNGQLSVKVGSLTATNGSAKIGRASWREKVKAAVEPEDGKKKPAGFTGPHKATGGGKDSGLGALE